MEVSQFKTGEFCWLELHTSDGPAAKGFYTQLFGWTAEDMPIGEGAVYTMLKLNGKNAGAAYQDNQSGAPPHWGLYISVPSADDAASKAKSLGGSALMEPFDVMDVGRMAVIQDPTGAIFSVWQAKAHHGFDVVDEPKAFCWGELNTRDTNRAREFYTKLFDYSTRGQDTGYTEFQVAGKSVGGMMEITAQMGDVPPNWLPYIQVDDCDAYVAKAQTLGGKACMPAMDVANVGRFAVLQDPQGAAFAIIKLAAK